jgi:hypothetical protein
MDSRFLSLWEKRGRRRSPTKNFANEADNNARKSGKRNDPAHEGNICTCRHRYVGATLSNTHPSISDPTQSGTTPFIFSDTTDTVTISSKITALQGLRN